MQASTHLVGNFAEFSCRWSPPQPHIPRDIGLNDGGVCGVQLGVQCKQHGLAALVTVKVLLGAVNCKCSEPLWVQFECGKWEVDFELIDDMYICMCMYSYIVGRKREWNNSKRGPKFTILQAECSPHPLHSQCIGSNRI